MSSPVVFRGRGRGNGRGGRGGNRGGAVVSVVGGGLQAGRPQQAGRGAGGGSPRAANGPAANVERLPVGEQVEHHLSHLGGAQGEPDMYSLQCLVNLAAREPNHAVLVQKQALPPLTQLLTHENEVIAAHAALALSNIARSDNFRELLGASGSIQFSAPLLERSTNDVLSKAVMLLTNLACCEANFGLMKEHEVVKKLLGIFEFGSEALCNACVLLLQNLAHLDETQAELVDSQGLRKIARCAQRLPEATELVENCTVIFAHVSFKEERVAALVDQGTLPLLTRQLNSTNIVTKNHAIRAVTNVALLEPCRDALFESGIVPSILECLDGKAFELLEHCCMTLSSLSMKETYANEMQKVGGMPHIALLLKSTNSSIFARAAKLIGNLAIFEAPRQKLQDLDVQADLQEKAGGKSGVACHYARIALQNLEVPITRITEKPKPRQELGAVDTRKAGGEEEKEEAKVGVVPEEKREKYRVHRMKVVQEIMETEKTYVANLISVVQFFMKPLQKLQEKGTPLVPLAAFRDIFSSVEILCGMHTGFLQELEASIKNKQGDSPSSAGYEDEPKVGNVFLGLVDCLRMYRSYISNYDKSIDVLSIHLENVKFKEFVNMQQTTYDTLKLSSILITPIQRIPRYSLLLQDLIKHMPSEHPDFDNLSTALSGVLEVADYLDVEKGKAEAVNKVLSIQEKMTGLPYKLVEPHRTFVMEGDVIAEPSLKETSMKYCHFFLFTDILVQTVQKGTKFRCKRVFELQNVKVLPLPAKSKPNSFRILTLDDGFNFTLSSAKEKDGWLETLNKCVYSYKKNSIQRRAASVMATNRSNARASEMVVS